MKNPFILLLLFISIIISCKRINLKPIPTKNHTIEEANIFILAGQSNAVGQHFLNQVLTNLPLNYLGNQKNILVWRNGNYDTSTTNANFENLKVPLNTRDKSYNNPTNFYYNRVGWSVEEEWLHQASNYYHGKVYLIKSAIGGLGISNWSKPNGKMYVELIQMINNAEHDIIMKGKKPIFRGLVWMQGEADVSTTDYYNQLHNLILNIRSLSTNTTEIPFIIMKIKPNTIYYSSIVDSAYNKIVQDDTIHNFAIETNLINGITLKDSVHYDDSSKLILGKYIFEFQKNHNQL